MTDPKNPTPKPAPASPSNPDRGRVTHTGPPAQKTSKSEPIVPSKKPETK